jgi:ribosome-binding factor A
MGKSTRTRVQHRRADRPVHSIRHDRLESLIREEINSIFESEMQNPIFDSIRITVTDQRRRDAQRPKSCLG